MDLTELRSVYDNAVSQIQVLETSLWLNVRRQQQARENGYMAEFDYLESKINILHGVIHMYEQFCNKKWTELQEESALALQEVLYGHQRTEPLTPPQSPAGSPQNHSSPSHHSDWSDSEIHIHMIPALLTPIRDTDDLLLTPPQSPDTQDPNYFSRNLMNTSLTELPVTRDI